MKSLWSTRFCQAGLVLLWLPSFPLAQQASSTDSTASPVLTSAVKDTIQSTRITKARTGLDSEVTYKAKNFSTDLAENVTYLIGEAEVKYKNYTISAGKITVLWNDDKLIAETLPDTTNGDHLPPNDSLQTKKSGRPVFSDGKEEMVGDHMEFNFKSERGRILRGRTNFQGGYYVGETVKRVSPREINVKNGIYTTCSKDEPHFHFAGKKMKIILDDKVIAKPVIFFIGKVPLAVLPFAMFPAKEDGRQSGIIIPQYGTSPQEGRYLQDLGYYWAASEYYDARFTLSFFEKTGVLFKTFMNYALRYRFRGSVSGSYTRKDFDDRKQRNWSLNVNHSHEIDATTRLSVRARFVSTNDFYKQFSQNRSQRLTRQLISNATFNKSWGQGRTSMSINLSQTKDLETGRNTIVLPRLQFTKGQSAIFPVKKAKPGGANVEAKWYNAMRYSYQTMILNTVRKDSTGDPDADIDRRAQHDLRFNFTAPKKILGWLTFSQNLTVDEDWFDRTQNFALDSLTNTVMSSESKGFAARHLFNYSASAGTNLYGTFYPRIGPVRALRHKMSPSLSFSYRPDFSDSVWGYFQSVEDTLGNVVKKDRFGGTPSGELNSLSFGLRNLFQMKLGEGEQEKKIDLFNLNFGSGYNFAADSLNWQNLATSFRANPKKNLNVTMSMTHSFYEFDRDANRTVSRLLFNQNGLFNFLRLTNLNVRAQWTLSGSKKPGPSNLSGPTGTSPFEGAQSLPAEEGEQTQLVGGAAQDSFAPESAFSAFDIPWRASFSFSYNLSKFNPANPTRTAYLDFSNVEVQLTRNWRIGYRLRYDLKNGDILDQRISFYRDLHCWEAQFNWSPSGISSGFYFRISIKAPHLRDIKVEQRGGTTSIFRPF